MKDFKEAAEKSCLCINDFIKGAEHGYSEAMKEQRWIPVSERLPDRNILVTVSNCLDKWVCCGEYNDDCNWYNQFSFETIEVTHWQPLPSPPSFTEQEQSKPESNG